MKRCFDVVVATVALLLSSPILAVAAVLIKLDSSGPVCFRQRRVGLHGTEFMLLKLRSMVVDAPNLGDHSTADADPRITRVGRFVRKTSMDELPQLVNVLRGEMSIVGPRPSVPAQETEYEPADWRRRVLAKPGITGLAQVSGRSALTHAERLGWDLEYIDSQTFRGDLQICLLTLRQLVRGDSN